MRGRGAAAGVLQSADGPVEGAHEILLAQPALGSHVLGSERVLLPAAVLGLNHVPPSRDVVRSRPPASVGRGGERAAGARARLPRALHSHPNVPFNSGLPSSPEIRTRTPTRLSSALTFACLTRTVPPPADLLQVPSTAFPHAPPSRATSHRAPSAASAVTTPNEPLSCARAQRSCVDRGLGGGGGARAGSVRHCSRLHDRSARAAARAGRSGR